MRFPNGKLIVFAKAPIAGQVKTRLHSVYCAEYVTALYRGFITHTLSMAYRSNLAPIELWCSPNTDHPFFAQCAESFGVELYEQQGSDLGQRMAYTFTQVLSRAQQAVMIGCDCPSNTEFYLARAFAELENGSEVVIGPATDGGYTLLGLQEANDALFCDMVWGTDQVLSNTLNQLKAHRISYSLLPYLSDIDFPIDLEMFIAESSTLELHPDLKQQLDRAHANKHKNASRTKTP